MEAALLLTASLAPLLLGPLVARRAESSTFFAFSLDRFVTLAVGGSMVLHVLPEAFHGAGWWSLPMAAAGFLFPFVIHRWWHHRGNDSDSRLFWLAFLGLALHATLDGVALFAPLAHDLGDAAHHHGPANGTVLALAVILHRFPMALAIWWLARPVLGRKSAIVLLTGIGIATIVGFFFADILWSRLPGVGIAFFEAMVAGMLLHIVIDHHGPVLSDSTGVAHRATLVGGLAGLALVAIVSFLGSAEHDDGYSWLHGVGVLLVLWLVGALWKGRLPGLLGGGDPFGEVHAHGHPHHHRPPAGIEDPASEAPAGETTEE